MASINSPHPPSDYDDDEEEENDDDEEDEDGDFQLCASSSATGQLPLPPHPQLQSTSASSSIPLTRPPESTSRALIPFTGSFPAFPSISSKPAIEALAHTQSPINASTADGHTQLNPSALKSAVAVADREPERKAESREHKKRSKNWTRAETLTLISLRTELAPRFAKAGRKSELWDEIAESMQKGPFCRDAQQCRDKWEKLMAGYKEVRDGIKQKDDNPYYEDLHPLLSGRIYKREREQDVANDLHSTKTEPLKNTIAMDAAQPPLPPPPPPPVPQYQFHSLSAHYGQQPFRAVLMDNHHPPLTGYHHYRHPLQNHPMEGKLHPPPILDGLPFRSLHMDAHYSRASAMDNLAASADDDDACEDRSHPRKRGKGSKLLSVTDLHAVQGLLESILAKQQMFFKELLDEIEKKEELREQMRREREEKWRAEERAQRLFFTEAMQILTHKLGVNNGFVESSPIGVVPVAANHMPPVCSPMVGNSGLKRRSKNWKRAEVLQLIKLRGEMEERFVKSIRRAALWSELAEVLSTQGVRRDGKQCREKWDKLMSEYKEVVEGKKEKGDSPYFPELQAALAGGGLDSQNDTTVSDTPSKEDGMQT